MFYIRISVYQYMIYISSVFRRKEEDQSYLELHLRISCQVLTHNYKTIIEPTENSISLQVNCMHN